MKAILINPAKHEVSAIEVELTTIGRAFSERGANIRVELATMRWGEHMLFYDKQAPNYRPYFLLLHLGIKSLVFGRGLLLGNGPSSTKMTVKDVQCLVQFSSK